MRTMDAMRQALDSAEEARKHMADVCSILGEPQSAYLEPVESDADFAYSNVEEICTILRRRIESFGGPCIRQIAEHIGAGVSVEVHTNCTRTIILRNSEGWRVTTHGDDVPEVSTTTGILHILIEPDDSAVQLYDDDTIVRFVETEVIAVYEYKTEAGQ